jgi:hypothetical protein
MSNKSITVLISLFFLIIIGMFLFTYLQKTSSPEVTPADSEESSISTNPYNITRIEGKHFFINGVHTIVGEIVMPTPCDLLTTEARIAESYPEQVTFNFTVLNTTDVCAQVVTSQRFKVEAQASKDANLTATFMGVPVALNLVEAAVGETPEEFELFIKG